MNKSLSISNLAVALVALQAEIPVVGFDAKNPHLKNKYATLGAVIETSKPYMEKHGLAITQFPISQDGAVGVTSILIHSSGEWIEESCFMTPEVLKGVNGAQSAGIVISYLRRYGWTSILGMYAGDDMDGDLIASNNANEMVKKIMADPKMTETLKRTWSMEQSEAVVKVTGLAEYEDAIKILDLSVLPENAPVKTVQSWLKHFSNADGNDIAKAQSANEVYIKAKNGGK